MAESSSSPNQHIQFNVRSIFEVHGILDLYDQNFAGKVISTRLINKHVTDVELNKQLKIDLKDYFNAIKMSRNKNAHISKLDSKTFYKLSRLEKHLDHFYLDKRRQSKFGKLIKINGRLLRLKGQNGKESISKNTRNWNFFVHKIFEIIIEKQLLNKGLTLKEVCVWVITKYEDLEEMKYNGYQFMLNKLTNKIRNHKLSEKRARLAATEENPNEHQNLDEDEDEDEDIDRDEEEDEDSQSEDENTENSDAEDSYTEDSDTDLNDESDVDSEASDVEENGQESDLEDEEMDTEYEESESDTLYELDDD